VRLFEGAIGPTRLAQATATACLDSQQRLAFDCHLEPAQARQTGHVKLSGSLPLTFTNQPSAMVVPTFTHACTHLVLPSFPSFLPSFLPSSIHPSIHPSIHSFMHACIACIPLGSGMTDLAVSIPNNVSMFPENMTAERNGDDQSQSCCLLVHSISGKMPAVFLWAFLDHSLSLISMLSVN